MAEQQNPGKAGEQGTQRERADVPSADAEELQVEELENVAGGLAADNGTGCNTNCPCQPA